MKLGFRDSPHLPGRPYLPHTIIRSMGDKLSPNMCSANEKRINLMFFFGSVFPFAGGGVTTSIGATLKTSVLQLLGQPQTHHVLQ